MNVVKFQKDSTLQRIKASYIEEDFQLTEHEEEIKKRLIHFHSLRLDKKYSRHQAIKIHTREMNVSKATAYRDASQSEYIMGNVTKTDVDFERAMLQEYYMNLFQQNLKKGYLKDAQSCLDSYKSLINFNAETAKVNPEKLEASTYEVKLSKAASKMMKTALDGGIINFNNLEFEDVVYKQLKNDE